MKFKNKYAVFYRGVKVGTTWAVSERQAINQYRYSKVGLGSNDGYEAKRVSNKPKESEVIA